MIYTQMLSSVDSKCHAIKCYLNRQQMQLYRYMLSSADSKCQKKTMLYSVDSKCQTHKCYLQWIANAIQTNVIFNIQYTIL